MQDYDEDLSCNPFLKFFQEHYALLYEEAVRKHWIVCVPAASSLQGNSSALSKTFDEQFIRRHLIIQQDGERAKTLADDPVQIGEDWLRLGASLVVKILFRETFYTNGGKVSALCIRQQEDEANLIDPLSRRARTPSTTQKRLIQGTVKQVKTMILTYLREDEHLSNNPPKLEECLAQIETQLNSLDSKISNCVVYNIYSQLMDLVTLLASKEDLILNRIRNNHSEASAEDLQLSQVFLPCLPKAQVALDDLPNRKIVSDKLDGLRRTVKALTETETPTELDADDLLALLTYLILKSRVTNWAAQLAFIKRFHSPSTKYGEDDYLISTLEAALDHVKRMGININEPFIPAEAQDDQLFHLARIGDATALADMLSINARFKCHPLCGCTACGLPVVPDPTRCDSKGFTALHYACIYGQTDATEVLLRTAFRENLETKDLAGRTALHWAALKGFQTCLLLLCHQQKCDLNAQDARGDTALHLAVRNGHESCVKALLYYSEQAHFKLDLDRGNSDGDTALHEASRWGYMSIVQLLIQWEANVKLLNKKRLRAADVAQNVKITKLLSQEIFSDTKETAGGSSRFWTGITRQLSFKRKPSSSQLT